MDPPHATTSTTTTTTTNGSSSTLPHHPVRTFAANWTHKLAVLAKQNERLAHVVDAYVAPCTETVTKTSLGQRALALADSGLTLVDARVEKHAPAVISAGEKLAPHVRATYDRVAPTLVATYKVVASHTPSFKKHSSKHVVAVAEEDEVEDEGSSKLHLASASASSSACSSPRRRRDRLVQSLAPITARAHNAVDYISHVSAKNVPEGVVVGAAARVLLLALAKADQFAPLPVVADKSSYGLPPSSSGDDDDVEVVEVDEATIGTLASRLGRRTVAGLSVVDGTARSSALRILRLASSWAASTNKVADKYPVVSRPRDAIASAARPITAPAAAWWTTTLTWLENKNNNTNNNTNTNGANSSNCSSAFATSTDDSVSAYAATEKLWSGVEARRSNQHDHRDQQQQQQQQQQHDEGSVSSSDDSFGEDHRAASAATTTTAAASASSFTFSAPPASGAHKSNNQGKKKNRNGR